MEQTSFITSKCVTQSGKYSMHCINYANREQEKPLLFKLTLRSRFTLSQAQSVSCHELLVVFGLATLNSHRTNHKPRKKKPIKHDYICPYDSAEFEHDIVHKFADALNRRFRASATQASPANPSILQYRLLFYSENVEITSWKARAYGIFTLVGFVSEISLVRCAHSFDFRYITNSCENPVCTRSP